MNFFDNYYLPGVNTPPTSTPNPPEQSLNEEVTQVIGQLGRFWGGLRKQSQTAFETARKDLEEVVSHAQKELSKLTTDAPREPSSRAVVEGEEENKNENDNNTSETEGSGSSEAQAGPSSQSDTPTASTSVDADSDFSYSSLFSRLQSAIPPNIVSTVQNNLPESLKHATENLDLSQLRTTLTTEFQRVQGATGEYVQRSEGLLREAMKEAGEVLRDAVKVIPPEEVTESGTGSFLWDGSEFGTVPPSSTSTSTIRPSDSGGKGKGKESAPSSGRPSGEAQRVVATRAESLLKQLRQNPAIVMLDPESDPRTRDAYLSWLEKEVEAKGGIAGDEWAAKVEAALNEPGDGPALQASLDELVPSDITKETFWKRYFFRVYQIQQEEEKRKALLQGSIGNEEVFSWEDEEEPSSPDPIAPSHKSPRDPSSLQTSDSRKHTGEPGKELAPPSQTQSPPMSPRESSEDSYDLLSSENVSAVGDNTEKSGSGDDSDWE